jgi:glycine/D-amino acid oxidase-like deaminating enzyme
MDLTAGYPFWLIKDGLVHHYPKLTKNEHTHVAIIGGGISGALAAWHLTEAGIECILIDGRSVGLGSTCASTSLLQYELDTPLHLLHETIGKEHAIRTYQLCNDAIKKIKIIAQETGYREYESNSSLFYSVHKKEKSFIAREFKARKEAGFAIDLLSDTEMQQAFGLQAKYGLLSQSGATINTYSFTHHLLSEAELKGLQVFDRSKIAALEDTGNGVTLTTEEGFTITASYVVNATGYEVVNFIDKDIVNFDCTYAIVSEHQEEKQQLWRDRIMMWSTDDPYLYMRLTTDNRILAGGRDEPYSTKVTRELYLNKKANQLRDDVRKVMPSIDFKTEFSWSGTFGKTKDSLPYIGAWHKTPRVFYALGFGGNGITFSVVAAEIITDLIRGKDNPDARIFSFTR